jgi:hypothetical protein
MSVSKKESAANLKALLDAGIPQSFIDGNYGGAKISKDEKNQILNKWSKDNSNPNSPQALELFNNAPDFLKNDPSFKNLPFDMQQAAVYNYQIQTANDQAKAQAWADALEQATAQADPYWKNIIRIAQDEALNSIDQANGDFNSQIQRNQERVNQINEDLSSNKGYLTLEQQNDLANLSKSYKTNLGTLIDSASNQGLTFSTKRAIAQQRLNEQNTGLVESTNRQYNKQIADLQTEAQRGNLDAQNQIADLQRRMQANTQNVGRGLETNVGTENLPALPRYTPLGGVPGKLYEEKTQDIEARKQTIYNDLINSSLNV